MSGQAAGLCAVCRHSRVVRTMRGSTFRLCERSAMDVRFPRYPALPVIRCPGYEPAMDIHVTPTPSDPRDSA